jgi:hypothetical protein
VEEFAPELSSVSAPHERRQVEQAVDKEFAPEFSRSSTRVQLSRSSTRVTPSFSVRFSKVLGIYMVRGFT